MHQLSRNLRTPRKYFTGFTLIELAVVMAIISVLAIGAITITTAALSKQRRDNTIARLALIETALTLFAAQNKHLPCPANGTLDAMNGAALAGQEQVNVGRTACSLGNQANGVIPWVTLGIATADAVDGWENVFTYRVEESLILANSMDFTMCTPGGSNPIAFGTAPNLTCQPCTTASFPSSCNAASVVTAGRGLRVKNVNNVILADPTTTPSTGAAYVLLSHGENQDGAFSLTGTIRAASIASGNQELNNFANATYPPQSATAYLVDDLQSYSATATHFDDFVLRPTILSLATKAMLGPRAY